MRGNCVDIQVIIVMQLRRKTIYVLIMKKNENEKNLKTPKTAERPF